MIVNDDSSIINKLETSLVNDARVVIYNHHMFIVQATGVNVLKHLFFVTNAKVFFTSTFLQVILKF
jgi:hypothetical protein